MRNKTRSLALLLAVLLLIVLPGRSAYAQSPDTLSEGTVVLTPDNPYGSGLGLQVLLTNSGFGMGGYYQIALDDATSFLAEISVGAGKDEQELKYFNYGTSYIQHKANYLLVAPIQAGITRRLFRQNIEDNFRPFLQLTAGPTLGWEYPYFKDSNGNQQYDQGERIYNTISAFPRGELRLGVGGSIALGAHFGLSRKMTQGVRIGYTFNYFFEGIQLLEPAVQDAQQFFGSPTITLIFGRLL